MTSQPSQPDAPLLFGIQQSVDAPLYFSVPGGAAASLKFSVSDATPAAPTQALACHLGNGVVQVQWQPSVAGAVDHYEIYVCQTISGVYSPCARSKYPASPAFLNNLPPGAVAYLQIRAATKTNLFSTWSQVALGIPIKNPILMECRCLSGALIPDGSIFTDYAKTNDRLIGYAASGDINFV